MRRTAAIDIGSTSILLLILENGDKFEPVLEKTEIANLSESIDKTGIIKKVRINSALDIISSYFRYCKDKDVKFENIILTGTEIFRTAKNTEELQDIIFRKFKKKILVLTGEEEAELSYTAQITGTNKFNEEITLIDIGGGSTEIIEGKKGNVISNYSMKLGASRITDVFFKNDPPLHSELSDAKKHILDSFKKITLKFQNNILTGVAATVTSACSVLYRIHDWNPELIHDRILSIDQVEEILSIYKKTPVSDRKKIIGLEKKRARTILGGTLILYLFMKYFKRDSIRVSVKGLRYGILFQEFYNDIL